MYHIWSQYQKTISDRAFQTSLFSKPQDFFGIFRENSTVINIGLQQLSRKQHIFGKRDDYFVVRNKLYRL